MSASRGAFFSGTTNPKPPALQLSFPTTRFIREGKPTRAPRTFTTSPPAIIARRTPFSSRRASESSPSRRTMSRTPTGLPVSATSDSTRSRNGPTGLATETRRHGDNGQNGTQRTEQKGNRNKNGKREREQKPDPAEAESELERQQLA